MFWEMFKIAGFEGTWNAKEKIDGKKITEVEKGNSALVLVSALLPPQIGRAHV